MGLKGSTLLGRLSNKGWLQGVGAKFFMHPVIGHVAKTDRPLHLLYLQTVAVRFNRTIQPKSGEHWIAKAVFIPHLLAIIAHLKQDNIEKSELLFSLASIYQAQADYTSAESLFLLVLHIKETDYGKSNVKLLGTLNSLASLKKSVNDLDEALEYNLRSLDISQKSLGPKHLGTSVAIGNLACVYKLKGEYVKALDLYRQALAINEAELEPTHAHVTMTLNRVAHLLKSMGRYAEALPLYQRTLAIRERTLGPDHVRVAAALNHLGMLYQALEELSQALDLYRRSLRINEKIFGPDSLEVAAVLNNIATLYMSFDKTDKALPYFNHTLKIREKIFGQKHSKIVSVLNSIANLHETDGQLKDAVDFYMRSLKINERFHGSAHPKVIAILHNLARIFVRRTNDYWTEAEFWQYCNEREAFHGDGNDDSQAEEMTFFAEHPCIGQAYYLEGKRHKGSFKKALGLHQKGLTLREKILPQHDPDIMDSLEAIGDTYYTRGDKENSIHFYEQVVEILAVRFGPGHVKIGKFLSRIALLYQNKHEVAKSLFDRAIEILRENLGDKDPLTMDTVRKLITLRKLMALR